MELCTKCVLIAVLVLVVVSAHAATTAFTYQGKLTDSAGVALIGSYNMTFKLYNALTGGSQVGSTVTLTGVSVSGGLFTVSLDFGTIAFNTGEDRWIETTVGTTTLSPRVAVTSVPTAIYAQSVPWSGVGGAPTSLPPSGAAGGDLTGTYPNPTVGEGKIDNTKLASDAASLNKVSGGVMKSADGGISIGTNTALGGLLQIYGPTYTMDQSQLSGSNTLGGASYVWQSFTAGVTGKLTAIYANVHTLDGSPWSKTFAIHSGEGTGGTLLSSQTASGAGSGFRTYVLDTPVDITSGTQYTFAFYAGSGSIHIRTNSANPYAGGICTGVVGHDAHFATYVANTDSSPALVVAPNTLNVGIGIASPAATLHVNGTSIFTGNVGIGVTSPTYRLQLPNTASAAGQGQANSWVTYSSARWKTNITPITGALEKVEKLQGVYYDWKPEQGGGHDIGFVAEEVAKILPEVVSWDTDGKSVSGMDYARVNALLVEAIKEQQKQMEAERADKDAKISDLQKQIDELKKLLGATITK